MGETCSHQCMSVVRARPMRPDPRTRPDVNVDAFETAILPYLDDAYTLARYLVRDEHDAQDVVQDAMLRAVRHFGGLRNVDARAWLLAIVRNCCYSWLTARRVDRDRLVEHEAGVEVADPRGADERAMQSSERVRVESALATLPLELREVVVLREVSELS